ncbi:muts domain V-domain-containing protein [Chaetomium tenue]|uniref:Muts domain V-domain-containing protein n=1 Tax=Chaetomium tenue TaxID=1854479 RepID=A0ACB7PLT4_9PEZI|nr:muts domain V-domain-containing protein [Chaetomium globosum]
MLCARSTSTPRLRIACLGRSRSLPPCSPATLRCLGRRNVTTALVHRGPGPSESLRRISHLQVRGKKTRTVFKLDDLPQGFVAPLEPLPPEEDEPAYPTVVLQARRNMQKFDNCVLLTRVGGFYELYFDQADEYGPLLNLKVAQKKTSAGPVPMAGFPFFQLDRFLKILVQDFNRHVAIAEEFPNDPSDKVKSGGLMHTRKVTRIVTPGTLIDENFMDPYANNYVMAIHLPEKAVSDDVSRQEDQHATETSESANDAATRVGLAWLDLSTGSFFTQPTTLAALSSVLSRVCPREVVLDQALESDQNHSILPVLKEESYLVTYSPRGGLQQLSDWAPLLESEIPTKTVGKLTDCEVQAGSILLEFVKGRLQGLSMKLQPPLRHDSTHVMSIDKNSMRSLEIKQTMKDGVLKGSLLHAIRRTVTTGGARLLNEWLSAPSTSLEVINSRQNLVSRFIQDEELRDSIRTLLRRSHDSQRIAQKFALNRGDADDLLRLANTIKATDDIVDLLKTATPPQPDNASETRSLSAMVDRISLDQPLKLAERIRDAIDEEGLVQQHQIKDSETDEIIALAQAIVKTEGTEEDSALLPKSAVAKSAAAAKKKGTTSLRDHYGEDSEVWIMKPGASPVLKRLHAKLAALREEKDTLTETLRARLGASSLTLRWSPGLGHICHVKGRDARSPPTTAATSADDNPDADPPIRTLSSSRSTRTFHQPVWTELGEGLDRARQQIRGEEQRVFGALRGRVVANLVKLRRNALVLDELDIATSFALLAAQQGLARPALSNAQQTIIVGGRHPTVEGGLAEQGRTFQRNDLFLGSAPGARASAVAAATHDGGEQQQQQQQQQSHGRIWLITGPNMAGKSTFLRQNALITILAQIGCYVPADYASLGIVDAIFSRVGSADNLFQDQSTFMVEMLETAAILQQATPRSFVIMDEVGRGTTPEDGTAVAFAALHHLVTVNKCRALFATHFHGIADLVAKSGFTLEDGGPNGTIEAYCTDVEEDEQGGFVYVHKLRKGVNRQSHALKVARLAGLPEQAIQVAQQVLQHSGVEMSPGIVQSSKIAAVVG